MYEFIDVIEFFIGVVDNLKKGVITLHSPLEEVVLKAGGGNLAYIDNRRDAKQKYGYDFWKGLNRASLKAEESGLNHWHFTRNRV